MLRGAVVLAILLSYISSDALYFARKDYLNLTYDAPLREIASEIDRQGNPRDLILLDVYNTDAAIVPLLPPRIPHILLDSDGVAAARRRVPAAATVWIVRNTHDVSPGQITTAVESGACAARKERDELLGPYAPWMQAAMRLAHLPPLTHFDRLTVCR